METVNPIPLQTLAKHTRMSDNAYYGWIKDPHKNPNAPIPTKIGKIWYYDRRDVAEFLRKSYVQHYESASPASIEKVMTVNEVAAFLKIHRGILDDSRRT